MKTKYTIGEDKKTLIAERSFSAPVAKVWQAWTTQEMLEKWWAPLPYKAITKSFDFKEGGEWHYYMQGPEGDIHWCLEEYETIEPEKLFTARDHFCDEQKNINSELPSNHWPVEFSEVDGVTTVLVTTTYASEKDLETVSQMGMKEGFDMGLNQLEALLV